MRSKRAAVSVLFNEPKLLKFTVSPITLKATTCFSALQRAEIAEILVSSVNWYSRPSFSALQRAEIAEMVFGDDVPTRTEKFQCSSTSRNC